MTEEKSKTPRTDLEKFSLVWRDGNYYVGKPNIDSLEVVPAGVSYYFESLSQDLAAQKAELLWVISRLLWACDMHGLDEEKCPEMAKASDAYQKYGA